MKAGLCLIFCLAASLGRATEVQQHGLSFEQWVADTFFGEHRASGPTDKWDIPASANALRVSVRVWREAGDF